MFLCAVFNKFNLIKSILLNFLFLYPTSRLYHVLSQELLCSRDEWLSFEHILGVESKPKCNYEAHFLSPFDSQKGAHMHPALSTHSALPAYTCPC